MNTQFKKGVLELCALTLLLEEDKYGYELADMLGKKMTVSETMGTYLRYTLAI